MDFILLFLSGNQCNNYSEHAVTAHEAVKHLVSIQTLIDPTKSVHFNNAE